MRKAWAVPSSLTVLVLSTVGALGFQSDNFPAGKTAPGGYTLRGKVSALPDGQSGAIIVELRSVGRHFRNSVRTYPGGSFRFDNVPRAAEYRLTASAPACNTCESVEIALVPTVLERGDAIEIRLKRRLSGQAGNPLVPADDLRVDPKALETWRRGQDLIEKKEWESARKSLEDAVRIAPDLAGAQRDLGFVLLREGRHEKVRQALLKASQVDPVDPGTWRQLGFSYLVTGEEPQSLEPLRKALYIAPEDVLALAFLGEALYHVGELEEAEQVLTKALRLDPGFYRASFRLGYVYLKLGRKPDALKAFERFLSTNRGLETAQVERLIGALAEETRVNAGQ